MKFLYFQHTLLSKGLRNEDCGDFDLFKNHLDIFLGTVPDQPTTPGHIRAAATNSLMDQVPLLDLDLDFNLLLDTFACYDNDRLA